jgi:drug/metabolite transporter (DMT)-like permease
VVVAVLSRALGSGPLGRAAPLGATLAIVALAILAAVAPIPPAAHAQPPAWELAAAAAAVIAAAALAARRLPTAVGLALAAGLLYGMTSIAMAVLASLPSPRVAAVAAGIGALVTAAGFLSFQRALQRGRPLPVATVMMAAMDVVAIAGGIVVLGDPLAAGAGARAAQLAALALTALSAVVVLRDRR